MIPADRHRGIEVIRAVGPRGKVRKEEMIYLTREVRNNGMEDSRNVITPTMMKNLEARISEHLDGADTTPHQTTTTPDIDTVDHGETGQNHRDITVPAHPTTENAVTDTVRAIDPDQKNHHNRTKNQAPHRIKTQTH